MMKWTKQILVLVTISVLICTLVGSAWAEETIMVGSRKSGGFGWENPGWQEMVYAWTFTQAGEQIAIKGSGTFMIGPEGPAVGPGGVSMGPPGHNRPNYLPLEEPLIDAGLDPSQLPPTVEHAGALMGAFVPESISSSPLFVPIDEDLVAPGEFGITSDSLFLIGEGWYIFVAPEPGQLYLGVNDQWVENNSGAFDVTLLAESEIELTVLSPNGGETLIVGKTSTIEWESVGPPEDVLLLYSLNNGQYWMFLDIVQNTGSYQWQLPQISSDQCLVSIWDVDDPELGDLSDETFTIFQCQGPIVGDLNEDCYVNWQDFSIFASHWLDCGNPLDPSCQTE